jgi:sulfur relay (sulfurtransferase) complex TusBCD TusD component (DsrE family)
VINVLFILNDAPVEPGRSLNGLYLASSMSLHASAYVRVFLLGAAAACASMPRGLREHEDAAALLATVIRHGGEVKVCERCPDGRVGCAGDLIEGATLTPLAELSRCVTEADRLLVF